VFWTGGVSWGRGWRVFGSPVIQRHRGSTIRIGDGLEMRSSRGSNPLVPWQPCLLSTRRPGASISIGDACGLSGTAIIAETSVEIGNRVLIGSNTVIVDTDFHPLEPAARACGDATQVSRPVRISDDVFVGTQVLILKGVTIGEGAVVGARSVVTRDVPSYTIVAGNPARQVGKVSRSEISRSK
jgi:acetyltransferase-like isoleucine patch superfamily enzyme